MQFMHPTNTHNAPFIPVTCLAFIPSPHCTVLGILFQIKILHRHKYVLPKMKKPPHKIPCLHYAFWGGLPPLGGIEGGGKHSQGIAPCNFSLCHATPMRFTCRRQATLNLI